MSSKILYLQYTNPAAYPSLEHSSRMLAREGWAVLFLGTGALGTGALRFPPHPRITVRQLSFCPAGWRQKLHYCAFAMWAVAWALRWRPGWVYASDLLACPIALLLSHLAGLSVVYHEHDSPRTAGAGAFARLALWARRRLAGRAKICVLPNGKRAEWFATETGNGHWLRCVWNCPARDEISGPRPPHDGETTLWLLYHGSIVPARLPPAVLRALAMLPDTVKLRVIGYETVGHPGYAQELRGMAGRLGIASRVEFLGAVPTRRDLFEWCRQCDVGLALLPSRSADANLKAMTGASNKPFDYLACGLALLVSDLPDWRALYVEPGYGLACDPDDPASITAALKGFLADLSEMRAMGERGRQRVSAEWNYETQFEEVHRAMGLLTGHRAGGAPVSAAGPGQVPAP